MGASFNSQIPGLFCWKNASNEDPFHFAMTLKFFMYKSDEFDDDLLCWFLPLLRDFNPVDLVFLGVAQLKYTFGLVHET